MPCDVDNFIHRGVFGAFMKDVSGRSKLSVFDGFAIFYDLLKVIHLFKEPFKTVMIVNSNFLTPRVIFRFPSRYETKSRSVGYIYNHE